MPTPLPRVVTRLGRRHASEPVIRQTNPRGEAICWIGAAGDAREAGEGTDFHATASGLVSITPLQVDLTDHAIAAGWRERLQAGALTVSTSAHRRMPPKFPAAPRCRAALRRARRCCARSDRCTRRRSDAARHAAPIGLGLDSPQVRSAHGRAAARRRHRATSACSPRWRRCRDISSSTARWSTQAYEDTSLPIGHGQTITKPSVVARMLELLFDGAQCAQQRHARPRARDRHRLRLPGGAAGAAGAAGVSRSSGSSRCTTRRATAWRRCVARAACDIRLVYGDGRLGHAPNAPYDSIIAAAGGDELPAAWLEQLAVGWAARRAAA